MGMQVLPWSVRKALVSRAVQGHALVSPCIGGDRQGVSPTKHTLLQTGEACEGVVRCI